jgi:uncharacterized membrane protein
VFSSGLSSLVFGGPAYLTLENFGYDYDKFYTTSSDIHAANWLGNHAVNNLPVYTDTYGHLKLQAYANITRSRTDLFVNIIGKDSYIYLDETNVVRGIAFTTSGDQQIQYTLAKTPLSKNKNTVYSAQGVAVLR